MNRLQQAWVWLRRIGHCRGFGIQSPTDYRFVRYVVNEGWPYYAYAEVGKDDDRDRRKLGQLCFRLANFVQPQAVNDLLGLADYLSAGCRKAYLIDEPIAAMLGIGDLLDKYPYEVSGGQKQRAAAARALITEPKLILADEPTGALDSQSSAELLRVFSRMNQNGQTILMVTHSTDAASHANRVLFIRDGVVFHQLYRGEASNEELYQKISDTLTMLRRGR